MVDSVQSIGGQLEEIGWRQGSILKNDDIIQFIEVVNDNPILIIASQSCDIANSNDPYIEISVGIIIETQNGNNTFNKNARTLHTEILCETNDTEIYERKFVELQAFEKIQIPKEQFLEFSPDSEKLLNGKHLDSYTSWLAARYSRPALPTAFNNLIDSVDPKNKRKKKAKQMDSSLSGIYVEIFPDAELPKEEAYRVNLLGLVASDFNGDITQLEKNIDSYADIMRKAGMEVVVSIKSEDQISIAMIKRFKRFYYDDISFRSDSSKPFEAS